MDENLSQINNTNPKPKYKIVILAAALLILGLVAGIIGTSFYYYTSLKSELKSASIQQSSLAEQLESLSSEVVSLDSQVDELSYTAETTEKVAIIETSSYSINVQDVSEAVMPSVVGVRTISIQEATSFFMGRQETVTQEVEGVGTGVIVSEDGLILTNQHVVSDNPKSITVTLMDGSEYDASVIYSDESMDLAVIKIEATGLTAAALGDSDSVNVGEVAIAIGNPLGLDYQRSVTAGIVSALDRSIQPKQYSFATNLIQTDATINSGNSGGPLLNSQGEVIGINTYKLTDGEGMGFAIPINAAIPIINQVLETGEFVQAKIGVSFIDTNIYDVLSDSQLTQLGLNDVTFEDGLLVLEIDETSDAYTSGVQMLDVLTEIDGVPVDTLLELRTIVYSHLPGDTLELTLLREGEELTLSVTLSEYSS